MIARIFFGAPGQATRENPSGPRLPDLKQSQTHFPTGIARVKQTASLFYGEEGGHESDSGNDASISEDQPERQLPLPSAAIVNTPGVDVARYVAFGRDRA